MKALDKLGIDVEITNERLPGDSHLKKHLMACGKHIKPADFEYIGSVATHLYKTEFGKEVTYAHHHHFETTPGEKFVSMAVSDLALHLMQVLFGRKKPGTLDKRDKRSKL